tara:strand:+ start:328 stop:516 length:189 start_codon:yes stop_codon:yes gene_type:complete
MEQKLKNKKLDKLKEEADKEIDYQGGGAYKAFLKLFYKNIIEEREKKNEVNISDNTTYDDKL